MRKKKSDNAMEFLKTLLRYRSLVPSAEVFQLAKEFGYGSRTIKKVKKELGIPSVKINKRWYFKKDSN